MNNLPEYVIEVTVVYVDGQKETITLKHRDNDEESARSAIRHHFKALEDNHNVERLTTTLRSIVGSGLQKSLQLVNQT